MKSTLAAAIAALLLPLPAAAQWRPSYPNYGQPSFDGFNQTYQRNQSAMDAAREQRNNQQQGFYQTRYQCGSSFYQCN